MAFPPSNLSRALLRIKDDGTSLTVSSGVAGSSDELKAGIWAMAPTRVHGYPGAPGQYLVLAEVIATGSPQQTRPARLTGRTLLTLGYDPAVSDPNVGPTRLWTAAGAGENGENVPSAMFFRRDGAGFITWNHRGNNGDATRTICGKYSTAYDGTTGWTELGTPPLIALGSSGTYDDYIVADAGVEWTAEGKLYVLYRSGSSSTNASISLATGTWDGNVSTSPVVTKYASNPVMLPGAGGSWSDSGIAPGNILVDPGGRFHMWPGARIATNSFGYAYSDNGGRSWVVSSTVSLAISGNPEESAGDVTSPMDDGDVAFVGFGGGWNGGGTEGRFGSVIPYEKTRAAVQYPGRFPYPAAGNEPSQALSLPTGGIQATNLGMLVFRFRKYWQTRSTDLGTIFLQIAASLDATQRAYVRANATGLLEALWQTSSGTVTLTSAAAVDDALWHKGALLIGGASSLELWLERDGAWTQEATSSATLGTVGVAVVAAIGNRPATYTAYGSHPLRGTYADVVFAALTSAPATASAKVAAFEGLLNNRRVVPSGGAIVFDSETAGGHTGDIPIVEARACLELPCVTTDGSSGSTDHEGAATSYVGLEDARMGILRVAAAGVDAGVVVAQLNGRPFSALPATRVGNALVQFFYILDADMPRTAGPCDWVIRVDGASGQVSAEFSYVTGRLQAPPVVIAATSTNTTISASVAATAGAILLDAVYTADSADDGTPHGAQAKQSSYVPNGSGPRLLTSYRPATVAGDFTLSWSGLTDSTQHLMAAIAIPALPATPPTNLLRRSQVAAGASIAAIA